MQTNLADFIKHTPEGEVADEILRKCVHCGFCTATCPTYQLTGDELDSPRGRIYQIKQLLEGMSATVSMQHHLDRCLTCRSCETTCPSGVQYGHLADIGRNEIEKQLGRPALEKIKRDALRGLMLNKPLFEATYRMAQTFKPWLPKKIAAKVLPRRDAGRVPQTVHGRKAIMLEGCVQPGMSPNINAATLRVLDRLGVELLRPQNAGCCGAVNLHMSAEAQSLDDMRRNIDAWWPLLEAGAEAVLINASGCGAMVKEYGYHLRNDTAYAEKAVRVSALAKDIVEFLTPEAERIRMKMKPGVSVQTLAYHPPCTLQHGQKLKGSVEALFSELGMTVLLPRDAHLCCGSAGTYSFFQPELSQQLRDNKLAALGELKPDVILSANIGCIGHLAGGGQIPVMHWIEYLDELMTV
ncbi:glycolate oxidase iron-sulfur subunit [Neisseria arctica]|uniref:Glycolate oxidase iron-sulfur subunit n=1 Tax=Neisseria arctica TaxID=1470200 RepID=A0A0J0YTK4_9NEIS|nr:glycolate oxidase subunit GlcF [Neisseria arctica]KLT73444.1 glycolate oxidase iron-sulfur subunit [Neisseria arctica]UOO86103.1 glycolate oxidase subunit GlcF [Neisseria arctica]